MRFTLKSVDFVKQITLLKVEGPHPLVEGLKRKKKSLRFPRERKFCLHTAFGLELRYQCLAGSLAFWLAVQILNLPGLQSYEPIP